MSEMHLHISVLTWIGVCFWSESSEHHDHLLFHIMDPSESSCSGFLLDEHNWKR